MPGLPATGADLHVDVPLSNIVVNRRPDGFIADDLLPITPVKKQSDTYMKFEHGLHRRYEAGLSNRAPGTQAKKIPYAVSSDTYFSPNYALGAEWPVEDEVNADDVLQWAESNAGHVTDRLMTDYEFRVAALAVTTGSVSEVRTVGTAWSINSAQAYNDILDAKEAFRIATGKVPNTLIIPEKVNLAFKTNDQFRDILFGDRGGVPTAQQIGNLVEIPKVLIPKALVNTATDESTLLGSFTYADIWGPHIYLAYTEILAGRETDTWLNAFRWTNPLLGTPFAVQRFPFDSKKRIYELEVGYYQDEKVVSPDLGMRIMNVVST